MKPPLLPPDEYEEIAFVRNLCADLIKSADDYFSGRYPNGTPFIPDDEDRKVLDTMKGYVRRRLNDGRSKYPIWNDDDIEALTETVYMRMSMRFKRIERNILKLPEYPMLVEAIVSAEKEPPAKPKSEAVVRMKPNLRLVKNVPEERGE